VILAGLMQEQEATPHDDQKQQGERSDRRCSAAGLRGLTLSVRRGLLIRVG